MLFLTEAGCTQNHQCVDEGSWPDGDNSYVYTQTGGHKDLYHLEDLSQSGVIDSLKVTVVAKDFLPSRER